MAEVSFDKAVEIVRQWGDLPAAHAEHYRTAPANRRPKLLAALIRDSAKERMAWDAVSLIAVRVLRDRERLPDELSPWLADTLDKTRERPKEDLQERNRAIVKAVRLLVDSYGFHPTRNGAGKCCSEGGSACDVVGHRVQAPDRLQDSREGLGGLHELVRRRDHGSGTQMVGLAPLRRS